MFSRTITVLTDLILELYLCQETTWNTREENPPYLTEFQLTGESIKVFKKRFGPSFDRRIQYILPDFPVQLK